METHVLIAHPDHPPLAVRRIEARVSGIDANWLRLRWRIDGARDLVVPPFGGKGRADGLWRTTCFEAFVQPPSEAHYVELNLSPSERWNLYDFANYRAGMTERPIAREPGCSMRLGRDFAIFDAAVPITALPLRPWHVGLACVIEETGGRLSYWALAHPAGKPDFHDPACFIARVPAADRV